MCRGGPTYHTPLEKGGGMAEGYAGGVLSAVLHLGQKPPVSSADSPLFKGAFFALRGGSGGTGHVSVKPQHAGRGLGPRRLSQGRISSTRRAGEGAGPYGEAGDASLLPAGGHRGRSPLYN